jgi:outer membrane protein
MNKKCLMIFLLFLIAFKIKAQTVITIEEVNKIVMNQSNKVKIIDNNFSRANIESSFYRISLLPKISSSISFPYQRSISEVLQSDGSQKFIERNYLNTSLNLTISQVVPFTGGSVSLSSSMNNSRDFNNNITSFSSNWANISYQQTINGFNSYKWSKKLNYLSIKKDSINYLKEKVRLKYDVSKQYLDIQLIQFKMDLLRADVEKTEKIVIEIEEKYKFGRVIKIEVEQTKIALAQLKSQLEVSELEYLSGIKSLKNKMNDESGTTLILKSVEQVDFVIDKGELIKAIKKNGFDIEKAIKLLGRDANMEKVKKEGAISINLQLGLGLNSSADNFSNLYDTPSQSQFVTIGTKIPILDWGKAQKNYTLEKLEKDNLELAIKDDEKEIVEQIEDLSNYKLSLISQKKSLEAQIRLSRNITEMYEELLKLGRKAIAEYKTQLVESYNIQMQYQKTINNLYLLKLKIDEFNLIF